MAGWAQSPVFFTKQMLLQRRCAAMAWFTTPMATQRVEPERGESSGFQWVAKDGENAVETPREMELGSPENTNSEMPPHISIAPGQREHKRGGVVPIGEEDKESHQLDRGTKAFSLKPRFE